MPIQLNLKKVHAFADGNYLGNPAGSVLCDQHLTNAQMQQLAKELEGIVAEVVFYRRSRADEDFDYAMRYFSCECEVPFCGHGTLAVLNSVLPDTPELLAKDRLRLKTNKGILSVENYYNELSTVFIHAPKGQRSETRVDRSSLADALNIQLDELEPTKNIEIYNAGQNTLLVPVKNLSSVLDCTPEYSELREFCFANNCRIINIFTSDTSYQAHNYRTRIFAPTFGYLEDPATGSGNAALGYYLENNGYWHGENLIIEQDPSRDNPNIVFLRKPDTEADRVMFGGKSIIKFAGIYYL